MEDSNVVLKLTGIINELTNIIADLTKLRKLPTEVDFEKINTTEKIVEVIKEEPVEVIKEVEKIVEVEVIKEVEKIVEVIKEIPVEVIKEVEKIVEVEVIKEIPVEKIVTNKPYSEIEEMKIKAPSGPAPHKFPKHLYYKEIELSQYQGELLYKPRYILQPNQKAYGIQDEWNVIVTFKEDKYITEHPQEHFNNHILTRKHNGN